MLICSLTLCLAMVISTMQDVKLQRKKLISQLDGYVSIIAFNARNSILQDDADTEDNRLSSFAAVNILHNVHIYKKLAEPDKLSFFSSYNRRDIGPHPVQFDRAPALLKPYASSNSRTGFPSLNFTVRPIGV